jgi:rod shape-determining protein MreC
LALLVVSSFALLTATYGDSSGGLQRGVSTVFSPVQDVADRALKPARDLANWVDETFEARGENDRLRSELAELRRDVAGSDTALSENAQLRKLLQIPLPPGYERVAGRVIARSQTVWYSTVTISAGGGDGVRVNDPVISDEGLVGRVTSVTGGSSQVTLITDHASAVTAKVVPEGVQGIATPEVGNPEDLILDFLDSTRHVQRGDMVVTAGWRASGHSSVFPYGIPLGRVADAPLLEQEASQKVHVTPFAEMRDLEFVEVLTGGERG